MGRDHDTPVVRTPILVPDSTRPVVHVPSRPCPGRPGESPTGLGPTGTNHGGRTSRRGDIPPVTVEISSPSDTPLAPRKEYQPDGIHSTWYRRDPESQ